MLRFVVTGNSITKKERKAPFMLFINAVSHAYEEILLVGLLHLQFCLDRV